MWRNAAYVIEMLDRACDGCTNGEFAAMVTAPVQKSTLMDAGYAFSGHTEYLAATNPRGAARDAADQRSVAGGAGDNASGARGRAARHYARAAALDLAHREHGLGAAFLLAPPRIAVLGLNPHAGEAGHLGREELDMIEPVIC